MIRAESDLASHHIVCGRKSTSYLASKRPVSAGFEVDNYLTAAHVIGEDKDEEESLEFFWRWYVGTKAKRRRLCITGGTAVGMLDSLCQIAK